MHRSALVCLFLLACAARPEVEIDGRTTSQAQAFTSADAVLVDFAFDAKLVVDTLDPPKTRQLLETQLMYLVGQLNADRSVGRHERLDLGVTTITSLAGTPAGWEIAYHVKLPVAWGGGAPPAAYAITLPRSVGQADQVAFAAKYSGTCTDPEGGEVDAGRMFLFFRPRQASCEISPADVVTTTATVETSVANTKGKYPEYHRVWEDDRLDVVAVFGREHDDGATGDAGVGAYRDFLAKARSWLAALQPDEARRATKIEPEAAYLDATFFGERKIRIDVMLVGPRIADEGAAFDAWYDAHTPDADLILYSGHAGLGENVRALAQKGTFRPKKYLISIENGCDTFAYLDPTRAKRRAVLNPEDPGGTKYMDTVSNVLGGFFHTGDATSLHLIEAMVSAVHGTPKTYPQIFEGIDPTQVMVVSGEEDNEFEPGMLNEPASASTPSEPTPAAGAASAPRPARANERAANGCAMSPPAERGALALFTLALVALLRRRTR